MPVKPWAKSVYWMFSVELNPNANVTAKDLADYLKSQNIATRPFFRGLHDQPALKNLGLFSGESYPRTDFAYQYGLYLPSGATLTPEKIKTVTSKIKEFLS